MTIGSPQGIYLAIMMTSIGVSLARFGQPKTGKYDFSDLLIAPAISFSLLWWGGFFG